MAASSPGSSNSHTRGAAAFLHWGTIALKRRDHINTWHIPVATTDELLSWAVLPAGINIPHDLDPFTSCISSSLIFCYFIKQTTALFPISTLPHPHYAQGNALL